MNDFYDEIIQDLANRRYQLYSAILTLSIAAPTEPTGEMEYQVKCYDRATKKLRGTSNE